MSTKDLNFEQWMKSFYDEAVTFYLKASERDQDGMRKAWDKLKNIYFSRHAVRIVYEPHKSKLETAIKNRVLFETKNKYHADPKLLISSLGGNIRYDDTIWPGMHLKKPTVSVKSMIPKTLGNPYII